MGILFRVKRINLFQHARDLLVWIFWLSLEKLSAKMGYVTKKGGIVWLVSEKEELHGNTE